MRDMLFTELVWGLWSINKLIFPLKVAHPVTLTAPKNQKKKFKKNEKWE
jgi:hypothetical protein